MSNAICRIAEENSESIYKRLISYVEVVYATAKEFGISLLFAIPAALFASTSGGTALVITSVIVMIFFNAFIRSAHRYYQYLECLHGPSTVRYFLGQAEYILCPLAFSIVAYFTGGILFHEAGHAFAVLTVLKNPDISIALDPFLGGVISYNIQEFTQFGAMLGRNGSLIWIAIAGPGISVAISTAALLLAWKYKNNLDPKKQERVRYLKAIAFVNLLKHFLYAISGLSAPKSDLGHDFVMLWVKGGMHPMLLASLIALPLLILLLTLRK